jgi:3-hydroxyacyl-CoA dehydrogenase
MDQARPADIVIEAVPERLATKAGVLTAANALCGPETISVTTAMGLWSILAYTSAASIRSGAGALSISA